MSGYHAAARAAVVTLMKDCATAADVRLQAYPARPAELKPPTGFVEMINETINEFTVTRGQHHPRITLTFVWGVFDSAVAARQRDAWVDAFYDYVRPRYAAIGANTVVDTVTIEDLPAYVPDWLPPGQTYYATQVTLEGWATD